MNTHATGSNNPIDAAAQTEPIEISVEHYQEMQSTIKEQSNEIEDLKAATEEQSAKSPSASVNHRGSPQSDRSARSRSRQSETISPRRVDGILSLHLTEGLISVNSEWECMAKKTIICPNCGRENKVDPSENGDARCEGCRMFL